MKKIALNGAGLLVALFAAFPVYWMISTSLKPSKEIFSSTPQPVPTHPTLAHYREILTGNLIPGVSFADFFLNSALVAVATVVLSGLVALLAATAVARFRFRLRTSFLIMLLIVQMIPLEALVIPLFLMIQRLGLYNTLPSLILTYLGFSLPFASGCCAASSPRCPRNWRRRRRSTEPAGPRSSAGSCFRWSHPVWWPPASSPSSPPGTS